MVFAHGAMILSGRVVIGCVVVEDRTSAKEAQGEIVTVHC